MLTPAVIDTDIDTVKECSDLLISFIDQTKDLWSSSSITFELKPLLQGFVEKFERPAAELNTPASTEFVSGLRDITNYGFPMHFAERKISFSAKCYSFLRDLLNNDRLTNFDLLPASFRLMQASGHLPQNGGIFHSIPERAAKWANDSNINRQKTMQALLESYKIAGDITATTEKSFVPFAMLFFLDLPKQNLAFSSEITALPAFKAATINLLPCFFRHPNSSSITRAVADYLERDTLSVSRLYYLYTNASDKGWKTFSPLKVSDTEKKITLFSKLISVISESENTNYNSNLIDANKLSQLVSYGFKLDEKGIDRLPAACHLLEQEKLNVLYLTGALSHIGIEDKSYVFADAKEFSFASVVSAAISPFSGKLFLDYLQAINHHRSLKTTSIIEHTKKLGWNEPYDDALVDFWKQKLSALVDKRSDNPNLNTLTYQRALIFDELEKFEQKSAEINNSYNHISRLFCGLKVSADELRDLVAERIYTETTTPHALIYKDFFFGKNTSWSAAHLEKLELALSNLVKLDQQACKFGDEKRVPLLFKLNFLNEDNKPRLVPHSNLYQSLESAFAYFADLSKEKVSNDKLEAQRIATHVELARSRGMTSIYETSWYKQQR